MFTRWKFQIGLAAIAAVLAVVSAAFLGEPVAYAQGEDSDYVDVELILAAPDTIQAGLNHDLNVVVVNNGSRTAYDVEVVLNVVYPVDSSRFIYLPSVPVGVASLENNGYTFRWSIPALGGLQREEVTPYAYHIVTADLMLGTTFDNSLFPHGYSGEVTTASFDSNPANNTDQVWTYSYLTNDASFRQVVGNYSVDVEVDETSPSPGDIINFTITADRVNPYKGNDVFGTGQAAPGNPPPIDLKVDIELTEGLTVTGMPSYAPADDRADSVSYSDGVFTIGTVGKEKSRRNSVTLPITVASDAAVNEQCLTATLTGKPPPGVGPMDDDISDNVAKVCLGDQPAEPFGSGQVDAFTVYPCVGNTNSPCDATDDVRVRAYRTTDERILGSGKALVHILEEARRKYDGHDNSVNAGTVVSWQIPVVWNAGELDAVNTQWSNLRDGFTASGINGGAPPGRVHIRAFEGETYEVIYKMTPDTQWTGEDLVGFNPGKSNGPYDYIAEFEKLGTYKLQYTAKLTRHPLDGDENCDPANNVNQRFCATETYIFHVGPIAELEVRDGGASSHIPADRNSLTIFAFNNGPDPSPGARVTGLPAGADVLHISQGSYDGTDGEWNIGELKISDYYRSRGEPNPSLVLAVTAGDTAEVSIINHEKYKVCIGSDAGTLADATQAACEAETGAGWHEGTVYDYKAANNTAKISAAKGGGGGPGAPGMRGAKSNSRSVTIAWDEVEYLHGVPVRHHEVQKYMADVEVWETVSGPLTDARWTDFNVGSGAMPAYRVRAVNDADVGGPWSAVFNRLTAQQQGQLAGPRLTAKWTAGDTIRLTWTEPSNQQDAITGYQLEYLAGDTWTLLASLAADETCADDTPRCYEDLGLPAGTERRYRVRAMAGQDPGRWSSEAVTATPPGAPVLWAEANGSNAILITWDPGSDAVTGFELETSSIGADGPYSRLTNPSGTTRSYSHNTGAINREARHYRLRACNSAGCGDWSFPDYATTAPQGVPTAPGLTVRSSTASEIKLSWNKPHAGASDITGYVLEHFTDGQNWTGLDLYPATATEYVHQAEFGGGTTHRYRVRAVNDVGEGAWSTVRSVSVAAGLPGQPELSFSDATDDSLTLSWTIPPTNGSRITGYRVERNDRIGGFDNWVRIGTTGASVTTYTDRNLYSGDWLCYRVVATSNVGTGAYSEEECESTTGQYAIDPDPPVLRLSSVSPNRVTIAWDPPPDDGGRPVQSYLYQQADENGDFDGSCQYASWDRDLWADACRMVSAGTRAATFSNLTAGDSYQFRVRAETTYIYGDWATAYARLPAARDDSETDDVTEDLQVRLSTTTLTVNEGRGESRYTVRLNKAPKEGESVPLDVDLGGALPDLFVDYEDERVCYGFEFNRENWNQGCVFTVSAREDRNADNEIAVVNHSIEVGGMEVTGPDVRIEVRDND